MWNKIFRTKEGRLVVVILGVAIIFGGIGFKNYSDGEQFAMRAVMAENYLKAGDYEQAIEAYIEALSVKDSDMDSLSIGLADAYIGLNDYDKALEALHSCYQKTSGIKVKEKIEEVKSAKTDYEYLQSISSAEVYYSNKEYSKSIAEYEKAKLIKSKDSLTYLRIAQAYIEMEEYELAKEELLEGQELVQSEELTKVLEIVDSYILKEHYEEIIAQAEELIYQENYKDGIIKYNEAIEMLPEQETAYSGLAETYIKQGKYSMAVILLQDAIEKIDANKLNNLLAEAIELKKIEEEKNNILQEIYTALKEQDYERTTAAMSLEIFQKQIAVNAPVLYRYEVMENDISTEASMIIYDSKNVYYGTMDGNIRRGSGIYFTLYDNDKETGYYVYDGNWEDDIPSGVGNIEEAYHLLDNDGKEYVDKTVTRGIFEDALENGAMVKCFYTNGKETGRVSYKAMNGMPLPMGDDMTDSTAFRRQEKEYAIGELYLGEEPTGLDYYVDQDTIWGVKSYMGKKDKEE